MRGMKVTSPQNYRRGAEKAPENQHGGEEIWIEF